MTIVETDVPARLDRLPWMRWHWMIVLSLGTTWILDGLEVTIVGAIGSALENKDTLGLTAAQIGYAASAYIGGAILGAIFFGHLTDRLGRKRLFLWTLALYVLATVLTACSWSFLAFAAFRFLTGTAIGGEYAAINSAIDELLPARVRGFADLAINGSYWVGTAAGAAASTVLLDRAIFPAWLGWRLAFGIGAFLAFAVVLVRRHVPESPRWLVLHGRQDEADAIVSGVERMASSLAPVDRVLRLETGRRIGFRDVAHAIFYRHRSRALFGLTLMVSQAFFYNAIFFTYALVLTRFYDVPSDKVGWYILPFAAGNFFGPLLLGRLFDNIGRRPMIAATYGISGVLLLVTGWLFSIGALTATSQTIAWSIVFFFASAAASSAYLTVSELFPVELRALAIALFYAVGTGAGGIAAPALFGALIDTGDRKQVLIGYAIGGALMILAAISALILGVAAERKALEEIAEPITTAAR